MSGTKVRSGVKKESKKPKVVTKDLPFHVDTHCGAIKQDGNNCMDNVLNCVAHTWASKEEIRGGKKVDLRKYINKILHARVKSSHIQKNHVSTLEANKVLGRMEFSLVPHERFWKESRVVVKLTSLDGEDWKLENYFDEMSEALCIPILDDQTIDLIEWQCMFGCVSKQHIFDVQTHVMEIHFGMPRPGKQRDPEVMKKYNLESHLSRMNPERAFPDLPVTVDGPPKKSARVPPSSQSSAQSSSQFLDIPEPRLLKLSGQHLLSNLMPELFDPRLNCISYAWLSENPFDVEVEDIKSIILYVGEGEDRRPKQELSIAMKLAVVVKDDDSPSTVREKEAAVTSTNILPIERELGRRLRNKEKCFYYRWNFNQSKKFVQNVEAALIDFLGLANLHNAKDGFWDTDEFRTVEQRKEESRRQFKILRINLQNNPVVAIPILETVDIDLSEYC